MVTRQEMRDGFEFWYSGHDRMWCSDFDGIRRLSDALAVRLYDDPPSDEQDERVRCVLRPLPLELRASVELVTGVWHGDGLDRSFEFLAQWLAVSPPEAKVVYEAGVALAAREATTRYRARVQMRPSKPGVGRPSRGARLRREKIRPKLRFEVLREGGFKCAACGRTKEHGAVLHIDHIIPVADGGGNHRDNLQVLCADCNIGKGVLPFHVPGVIGGLPPDILSLREWIKSRGYTEIDLASVYMLGPNRLRDAKRARTAMRRLETGGVLEQIQGGAVVNGHHRREVWRVLA